jgi:hypothetical protein
MTKEQSKKHLNLMRKMEADRKHQAEENMYRELDEQKDSEYIRYIASNGGYGTQLSW